MMNKEQKKNYIEQMTTQFDKSEAVIVTHYQGLTVSQLDDLRKRMREHGIKFKITNNRITKLALEKTRCKELSSLFNGPTAVAISEDAACRSAIPNFDSLSVVDRYRAYYIYDKSYIASWKDREPPMWWIAMVMEQDVMII